VAEVCPSPEIFGFYDAVTPYLYEHYAIGFNFLDFNCRYEPHARAHARLKELIRKYGTKLVVPWMHAMGHNWVRRACALACAADGGRA
jgi:hypothetical protein